MRCSVGIDGNTSQRTKDFHPVDGKRILIIRWNRILIIRETLVNKTADHADISKAEKGIAGSKFSLNRQIFGWQARLQQIQEGEASADRLVNFEKYVNALKPADVQAAAKLVMAAPSKLIGVQMPEGK